MRGDIDHLDEQIERLRNGGTLTENEVKILCDKVSMNVLWMWLWFGFVSCRLVRMVGWFRNMSDVGGGSY